MCESFNIGEYFIRSLPNLGPPFTGKKICELSDLLESLTLGLGPDISDP